MSKLFKFQNEETQEDTCQLCQLAEEFQELILDADDEDELAGMLHTLVEVAFKLGYKQAINGR